MYFYYTFSIVFLMSLRPQMIALKMYFCRTFSCACARTCVCVCVINSGSLRLFIGCNWGCHLEVLHPPNHFWNWKPEDQWQFELVGFPQKGGLFPSNVLDFFEHVVHTFSISQVWHYACFSHIPNHFLCIPNLRFLTFVFCIDMLFFGLRAKIRSVVSNSQCVTSNSTILYLSLIHI